MKYFIKLFLILLLFIWYNTGETSAEIITIPSTSSIEKVSMWKQASGNLSDDVTTVGKSLLTTFKVILQGLLLIYIVYIGITMITSMWSDDDKLSKSKSQLWYMLVALIFINVPSVLYWAFKQSGKTDISWNLTNTEYTRDKVDMLVNFSAFWLDDTGFLHNVVSFLQILIVAAAVFVILMAGINLMSSRWRDEKISEAKNKLMYTLFALIFVGFIEAWKQIAITGKMKYVSAAGWKWVFGKLLDMALLFAWPVAIFFLTLAWYYYITSNGEEEKVKKAKSIVINTLLWILLLLIMVLFLNDLSKLTV